MSADDKLKKLKEYLKNLESVTVAFSGGVDSTFLLKAAQETLKDHVVAVTAKSYLFPERELKHTIEFCKNQGICHIILERHELDDIEGFRDNPESRCYICKKDLMKRIIQISRDNGMKNVVEGSNADDLGDYRPGMRAVKELKVKSPLQDCNLYKEEIRMLSRRMELPTWNKPSLACLASRFVYGETITAEKLHMVDQAEQLLFHMGFKQARVRIHGKMARIEIVPGQYEKLMSKDIRKQIVEKFKEYGFTYVSADLEGYRTGSMNETASKAGEDETAG